jgi:DNA repair protein RadC
MVERNTRRVTDVSITRGSSSPDGPREKLAREGVTSLADHDLLRIVLGHGTARTSAEALATTLLGNAAGLHGLTRMTLDEICQTRGLGVAQAARVLAAIELGRRTLLQCPADRPQFIDPALAAAYLLPRFGAFPVERFGLVLVDTKYRLLRTQVHSIGSLDSSMAHPRDIFRAAVGGGAAALVLFHNHPSGDPHPSPEDIHLTHRLVRAGRIVGVPIVDHLILADTRFYSFRAAGLLDRERPAVE